MSWWNTGIQDDIIGDEPANILGGTFRAIVKIRKQSGRAKPLLQEVLDSILVVLRANPEKFLINGKTAAIHKIVVQQDSGETLESSAGGDRADSELIAQFDAAFAAIAMAYEKQWRRKPNLRELMSCLAFVLRYNPAEFIGDAKGLNIDNIIAD